MAVRYGTFRIYVLRTWLLEPYRTSVPYFSSIFEAYRTRTIPKKAYRTSVLYFLAKIEAYRMPSLFVTIVTEKKNHLICSENVDYFSLKFIAASFSFLVVQFRAYEMQWCAKRNFHNLRNCESCVAL